MRREGGEFAEKTCGGGQSCLRLRAKKKAVNIFLASAVSASLSADRRGQFWRLLGPQPAEGKSPVVAKRGKKRRGGGGGGKNYGTLFLREKGGD